ncbi:MAG TPA: response regulator transcription factor [Tepidiformaceae bacterium]|nr:response regulator transcription factor [Tepidiformaceae bacterium]
MSDQIRVLLADDHDIVRAGLKAAIRNEADFTVVGEARDGNEAVREARRVQPDLIVMDVRMPRLTGIEACREIRSAQPEVNVLMLTSYADDRAVMAALVAGASGFLLKEVQTTELLAAMRTVGRGGKTLDSASSAAVIEQIRRGMVVSEEDQVAQHLSERELAILDMIAEGLTNREIAERLYLSEKTVKHHVSDILAKLGVTRRVEAAAFAVRRAAKKPPAD